MSEELSVLIVEDDPDECRAFIDYTASADDIHLIGTTNSSTEAIQYVLDYLPDAVILDLELHRGSGSGIVFLKDLRELSLSIFPYILVTTNNASDLTHGQVRSMGADFIMAKYQQDYSAKSVIEFLRIMKTTIRKTDYLQKSAKHPSTLAFSFQNTKGIVNRISRELDFVGISPKAVGRKYLLDAIQLVMSDHPTYICSKIAQIYRKSDGSVERAMQNAINRAWRTSCIDDLERYYTARINPAKGVPTLTEFIYYYAEKIKRDHPVQ